MQVPTTIEFEHMYDGRLLVLSDGGLLTMYEEGSADTDDGVTLKWRDSAGVYDEKRYLSAEDAKAEYDRIVFVDNELNGSGGDAHCSSCTCGGQAIGTTELSPVVEPVAAADRVKPLAERVQAAQGEAFRAVFGALHAAFPDAISDDMDPETEVLFKEHVDGLTSRWVDFNVPVPRCADKDDGQCNGPVIATPCSDEATRCVWHGDIYDRPVPPNSETALLRKVAARARSVVAAHFNSLIDDDVEDATAEQASAAEALQRAIKDLDRE